MYIFMCGRNKEHLGSMEWLPGLRRRTISSSWSVDWTFMTPCLSIHILTKIGIIFVVSLKLSVSKPNLQQVGCLWLAFSSFSAAGVAEMWRLQLKLSFGSLVTWHLLLFWINVNQLLMLVVDYRLVLLLLLVLTRERLQFKLSFGGWVNPHRVNPALCPPV